MVSVIKYYIFPLFLAMLSACLLTGCLDDTFGDFFYGDGDANLNATVEFENLTPALETRAAGDAVGAVHNLQMVIYRVENGETKLIDIVDCTKLDGYSVTNNNVSEPDDKEENGNGNNEGKFDSTEETTDHADFKFSNLPYGRYKIYAVANVSPLTEEQCKTEDDLKSIQFTWNPNVTKDDAMFGYFTRGDNQSSSGFDAPVILINSKTVNIHAWIKRLVSKVTVAFDPSGLEESVTVYVKSVTIHDIPRTCYLGKENKITSYADTIKNGETIKYYNAATEKDYTKWDIILQKGSGKKGSSHSNASNALYFFENMQGNYQGQKPYLKEQIPEETGTSIDEPGKNNYGSGDNDYKDRVKFGTYIEVEAYYVSNNSKKMSSGKIKYRFMLGKDVTYDYNAQRNYHYKLTLKLRGFANEADWHISYTEPTPSVYTPDIYYISYLYGQASSFPVRILTGDAVNTSRYTVKAEIIENPWWAFEEDTGGYPPLYIGKGDEENGFAWIKGAVEANVTGSVMTTPLYTSGVDKNFAGFLALHQPEIKNGKYADIEFPNLKETATGYTSLNYGPAHNSSLKNYYTTNHVGEGAYKLVEGTHNVGLYDESKNVYTEGPSSAGQYTVTRDKDESVTLNVPFYTRPQKMVAASDFTGNNPYLSYMRRAIVRVTLWNENGEKVWFKDIQNNDKEVDHSDIPIYQVRRIENPKAIYREWDNTAEFKVKLMHLTNSSSTVGTEYSTYTSRGAWRASIVADPDGLVELKSNDGTQSVKKVGDYIYGSTGETIEFTYAPRGKCANANTSRCAMILVEYHDYTCNHMIFVRQGYDSPVNLAGTNWSCYQVYATGKATTSYDPEELSSCNVIVTESPLSMGSLLKRCQYNYSIREKNAGWLKNPGSLSVTFINASNEAATKTASWANIGGIGWKLSGTKTWKYNVGWAETWTAINLSTTSKFTVPTREQYEALRDKCDFGFGIVYGDGATETANNTTVAYGYIDENNTNVKNAYGVRACVVYDRNTGANVIFPMGKEGMGRRPSGAPYIFENTPSYLKYSGTMYAGTLSYGGMGGVLYTDKTAYRPLTYNHYRSPGAVYWTKTPYYANGVSLNAYASWDMNYFTLTFNKYDYGSIGGFTTTSSGPSYSGISDALPIKLIYTSGSSATFSKRKSTTGKKKR